MELSLEFTKQWDNSLGDHTTTLIIGRVKVVHIRKAVLKSDHALVSNFDICPALIDWPYTGLEPYKTCSTHVWYTLLHN